MQPTRWCYPGFAGYVFSDNQLLLASVLVVFAGGFSSVLQCASLSRKKSKQTFKLPGLLWTSKHLIFVLSYGLPLQWNNLTNLDCSLK